VFLVFTFLIVVYESFHLQTEFLSFVETIDVVPKTVNNCYYLEHGQLPNIFRSSAAGDQQKSVWNKV